jgi:F0F1-type ATP synthase membrane subunit b/b'
VLSSLLEQLGVNSTFFIQLAIVVFFLTAMRVIFFKPFQALFDARHEALVEDAKAAESMVLQANEKLAEYQRLLGEARKSAQQEVAAQLARAKDEENRILQSARDEVKKIFQEATSQVESQKTKIRQELDGSVDSLATQVVQTLLSGK